MNFTFPLIGGQPCNYGTVLRVQCYEDFDPNYNSSYAR